MPSDRLFCFDPQKKIVRRADFDAADDQAAISYARQHYGDFHCEIWEMGRKVAIVPVSGGSKLFDAA